MNSFNEESTHSKRPQSVYEAGLTHTLNSRIEAQVKQIRVSSIIWSFATLVLLYTFFVFTLSGKNGDSLLDRTGADLLYRLRNLTSQEIKPSDKLKIFLFEDQTVGKLGTTEIKLSQWDQVIRTIAERSPAAIYVDRVFSVISEAEKGTVTAESFAKDIDVPIYSAAFVSNSDLPGRQKIPNSQLSALESKLSGHFTEDIPSFDHAYGAADFLTSKLKPGHVVLFGEMNFLPFVNIQQRGVLPHLGVRYLADRPGDVEHIPSRNGYTTIRYLSQKRLLEVSYPLYAVLGQNPQNNMVNSGDHVLIVPAAYTGNVDYKDTPVGRMIGGYYVASILNSAITGTWLTDYGSGEFGVYLLLLIGFALGLLKGAKGSLYSVICGLTIAIAAWLFFCYFEVLVPWLQLASAIAVAGTVVGGLKSREQAARAKLLIQANAILSIDNQLESERKHHLLRERREAMLVAQTFKPEPLPERIGRLSIHGFFESADEASGDWFFVRSSESGEFVHILMCDVVGHGMHAAMIVACCKATFGTFERTVPKFLESMDALTSYVSTINEVLFEQGQGQHCTTVCAMSYNQITGEAQLITCGHPPIIRIQQKSEDERSFSGISTRSDPVGLNPTIQLSPIIINLAKGESLLMYTDGLPVASRFSSFKRFARNAQLDRDFPTKVTRHLWEQIFDRTGVRCEDDISVILCVFENIAQENVA